MKDESSSDLGFQGYSANSSFNIMHIGFAQARDVAQCIKSVRVDMK